MQQQATSPMPSKSTKVKVINANEVYLTFYEALNEMLNGKIVTKADWRDKGWYGQEADELLKIYNPNDSLFHPWIISRGDIMGKDWFVIN